MVYDIKYLFSDDDSDDEENQREVYLWDNIKGKVENAKQYHEKHTDGDFQ